MIRPCSWRWPPQEPLWDPTIRLPQITPVLRRRPICYGARYKRDRMVPAPATIRSIRTRDTRCPISPCKIPVNLPYKPRCGSPRWAREPRRKRPESSRIFARQYAGERPVMPAWRSMAYGAQRYRARRALREKPGQRKPVICLAHPRPPSGSLQIRVTPFVGRIGRPRGRRHDRDQKPL